MFTRIFSKKRTPSPANDSIDMDVLQQGLEEIKKKEAQAVKVLGFLDIPCSLGSGLSQPMVPALDLVKILTNEKKLKILVSKLRNKAFW